MQYALEISHAIRNGNNRFYTTCTIAFSEEEKAIIRERNMGVYSLLFKKGYVNYPALADEHISDELAYAVYAMLAIVAIVLWARFSIIWSLILGAVAFLFADHKSQIMKARESAQQETITLAEIIRDGSFSVCGFDDMFKSKAIEQEMHEQMERLKALLNISGEDLEAKWRSL